MDADIKYYEEHCKQVNCRYFRDIKKEVIQKIQTSQNAASVLLFADWLFHKLRLIWHAKQRDYIATEEYIKKAIVMTTTVPIKMKYINWRDVDYSGRIMYHFYKKERFDESLFLEQMLNDSGLLKYERDFVRHEELLNHFLSWIERVQSYEHKSNLLDILLRYFYGNSQVRAIHKDMMKGSTLYQNEQSVHDGEIHSEMLRTVKELHEWALKNPTPAYRASSGQTKAQWLCAVLPGDKDLKEKILDRIKVDETTFEMEDGTRLIAFNVLFDLMNYILSLEERGDIMISLEEEMRAAANFCITGHVARFINALQGYTDKFQTTISFEKHLYSKINHDLSKLMLALPEESNVILGTYDIVHRRDYFDFITSKISVNKLKEQYGAADIDTYLPRILYKITGSNLWSIVADKVINNPATDEDYKQDEE